MPKILYNEGRVVGLSAYETYVKNHIAEDPNTPPASEREWLASSLASGASILLKFPEVSTQSEDSSTIVDIPLPQNSKLCAANTIVANYFKGDASLIEGDSYFAKQITSYGQLLSNDSNLSPSGTISTSEISDKVKPYTDVKWTLEDIDKLSNYMKIVDGLVIHPGDWQNSETQPPEKTLIMDPSQSPVLRFQVLGHISQSFWILLTGFSLRTVVVGESGLDSSTDTESPQDGDYLGPATFPWASKIIFSVPSSAITYFSKNKYKRTINSGESKIVNDNPVIDMREIYYNDYYKNYPDDKVSANVEYATTLGDGSAILTVFQRDKAFPPALYGTYVTKNHVGEAYLYPIDTVAPGTVKVLNTFNDVKNYESSNPSNYGLYRDSDHILNESVGGTQKPVAKAIIDYKSTVTIGDAKYPIYKTQIETGNLGVTESISLKKDKNTPLCTSGGLGTIESESLNWDILLAALGSNRKIDVLGETLRTFKTLINGANNGSYNITIKNGKLSLNKAIDIPEFFIYKFPLTIPGGLKAYESAYLEIIGWTTDNNDHISTLGSLNLVQTSNLGNGLGNGNWFQKFSIHNNYKMYFGNLWNIVQKYSVSNMDLIRINLPTTTAYINSDSDNGGAPNNNPLNAWTGYIDNSGDGIIYCKNGGSTSQISSQSLMCSIIGMYTNTDNGASKVVTRKGSSANAGNWS